MSPLAMEGLAGVTAIETSCAAVTVMVAEPTMLPEVAVAVIMVIPTPTAVARPCDPVVLEIVAMEGLVGVTAIDTNWAAVTVRVSLGLVMPPWEAVMPVVPAATPVASPVLLMVATAVFEEVQVTPERTWVELSLKVPVAVNC